MSSENFFDNSALKDPTWKRAQQIVDDSMLVPSHIWSTLRKSWLGQLDQNEMLHNLSFSHLNIGCLLSAAGIQERASEGGIVAIKDALTTLGIPLAGVVLAVNYTCTIALKKKPPVAWRAVYQQMMDCIEIGAKMGARVEEIGTAGGALIGFSRGAGLALLMSFDAQAFKKWYAMTQGVEGREMVLSSFGCEPFQVAAFCLQKLGYGTEISMGAAIATGDLHTDYLTLDRDIKKWRAAFKWIDALREGRGFPAEVELRSFFQELTPPSNPSVKNPVLDTLYTEVARVKRSGSEWSWHLPRQSYDETQQMLDELS